MSQVHSLGQLGGKTLDFITDNAMITIPSTTTNSTGGYSITGLVAPNLPSGTIVHITAKYAGETFFRAVSVTRALKIN